MTVPRSTGAPGPSHLQLRPDPQLGSRAAEGVHAGSSGVALGHCPVPTEPETPSFRPVTRTPHRPQHAPHQEPVQATRRVPVPSSTPTPRRVGFSRRIFPLWIKATQMWKKPRSTAHKATADPGPRAQSSNAEDQQPVPTPGPLHLLPPPQPSTGCLLHTLQTCPCPWAFLRGHPCPPTLHHLLFGSLFPSFLPCSGSSPETRT